MDLTTPATAMPDSEGALRSAFLNERARLGGFIRRQVRDGAEAEDILQDVFSDLVEAWRLPEPIEQVGAWLFRVARHRIVDRFRKKRETSIDDLAEVDDDNDGYRLDLALPSPELGPEAQYARAVLLRALQAAVDELPAHQREVFVAHEIDGISFKALAARSGVPLNTLLARKRYAVLHLRERLQGFHDDIDN